MTAAIAPHVFNNAANAWGECRECGELLATPAHRDAAIDAPSAMPEWRRRAMRTAARSGNFAARDTTTPTR